MSTTNETAGAAPANETQTAEERSYYERKRAAAQAGASAEAAAQVRDDRYGGRVLLARLLCGAAWLGVGAWCLLAWELWPLLIGVAIHLLGGIYVVACDISAGQAARK